jgi:hypothetical protein
MTITLSALLSVLLTNKTSKDEFLVFENYSENGKELIRIMASETYNLILYNLTDGVCELADGPWELLLDSLEGEMYKESLFDECEYRMEKMMDVSGDV